MSIFSFLLLIFSWQPNPTPFGTPKTAPSSATAKYNSQYAIQSRSALNMVVTDPTSTGPMGGFTATNAESRRVIPEDPRGRPTMKVVYVVLDISAFSPPPLILLF